jgi:hypothetical protein
MTEHTPTPWKAFHTEIRDTSGHEMSVGRMSILAGAGIRNGKVESYRISDEEAYANAAHIVKCVNAFPDLVKALEDARAALEAIKFAVEASGKLNDRGYISLGIQVNNALDKSGGVLGRVKSPLNQ